MSQSDNLVWMDLEMTGLEPERDVIIEIATIVTDGDLNIIAEGQYLQFISRTFCSMVWMNGTPAPTVTQG